MSPEAGAGERTLATGVDPARRRAAIETYTRHEASLRKTARRFSICADDAEDALQRALEILLRKAPSDDPHELIRWTLTVVRHEALAVRRDRERLLAGPAASPPEAEGEDWVARIPTEADGPPERAERREAIARSREALRGLKPHELRALTLLAEGYSYAEIGEITGFSSSKVNHCVAKGRERFRRLISRSEDGSRCEELGTRLSAFCDGEIGERDADAVREHLRACPHCRSTLRAYRAAPAAAAALAPTIPFHRSLLDRVGEALTGFGSRFGGGDTGLVQVVGAGGSRGAGTAALAKALALCVGTVGGAAACVATGVVPAPLGIAEDPAPRAERPARLAAESEAPAAFAPAPEPSPEPIPKPADPELTPTRPEPTTAGGAVEYTPPPTTPVQPTTGGGSGGSGDASGEFGP